MVEQQVGLKLVSTGMASMLVTGLVAWFTFGAGVRAEEVKKMIQESPSIVELKGKVAEVQKDVDELSREVEQNNQKTQEKLDVILQFIPRDSSQIARPLHRP